MLAIARPEEPRPADPPVRPAAASELKNRAVTDYVTYWLADSLEAERCRDDAALPEADGRQVRSRRSAAGALFGAVTAALLLAAGRGTLPAPVSRVASAAMPSGSLQQGDVAMDRIALALPVLPGKTEQAWAFMRELEGPRRDAYVRADREIGVAQETWFLQQGEESDLLLLYMEGPDLARTFGLFIGSEDRMWVWFKRQLLDVTGQDWNAPPPGPPSELLSHYEAAS